MGKARDAAGNIWETDAAGNAVRLLQQAPQGGGGRFMADPYKPKAEARAEEDQGFERRRVVNDEARLGITQRGDARDANSTALTDEQRRRQMRGNSDFDQATKLRTELEGSIPVKMYRNSLGPYGAAMKAGDNPAGDLTIIYSYAKISDPDSAVREAEGDNVANLGTYGQKLYGELRKQLNAEGRLEPDLRRTIMAEMGQRMGGYNNAYKQQRRDYTQLAQAQGVDPKLVVLGHAGDAYAATENQYWRGNPNRGVDAARGRSSAGNEALATGATRKERDPKAQGIIDSMVRGGATAQQINSTLGGLGYGPDAVQPGEVATWQKFLADHPDFQGSISDPNREIETSFLNRAAASPVGTALGAGADASMAGLSDELGAALGAGSLDDLNRRKQMAFAENPKSAFGGQVGGTIASMVGLGAALKGVGLTGALADTGLAADIGFGAASGAGQNNDHRLFGSVIGGAAGAVMNPVGGALASGVGAAARTEPGLRILNALRDTAGKIPGVNPLAPIASAQAPSSAESAIAAALARADPAAVSSTLDEASRLGVPMALADTAPSLGNLAGASARRSDVARNLAETTLIPRNRDQIVRLGGAVERELGPIGDTLAISKALRDTAQRDAKPLYDAAYAAQTPATPELDSLLATPFARDALGRAKVIAANERRDPMELGFALDDAGNPVLNPVAVGAHADYAAARSARDDLVAALDRAQRLAGGGGQTNTTALRAELEAAEARLATAQSRLTGQPSPDAVEIRPTYSTQTLDYTKRGMDDVLEAQRNPITNRLELDEAGRAQNAVKNDFLREVDQLNPAYGAARQAYAGPMESLDALHRGQDFYSPSVSANQVRASVAQQNPEHLAQMQLGYRDALMDQANGLRYSTNPWNVLDSPTAEAKLTGMYGVGRGLDKIPSQGPNNLLAARDLERQLAGTSTRVIGGSQTAERQIADEAFLPGTGGALAIDAVTAASGGVPVASVARRLATSRIADALRLGVGRRAEQKASEIAPLLLNTAPDASQRIAKDLLEKARAWEEFVGATTPKNAGRRMGAATGEVSSQRLGR